MTSGERAVLAQIEAGERPTFPAGFLKCGWQEPDNPNTAYSADWSKPPKGGTRSSWTRKKLDAECDRFLKAWSKNHLFEGIRGTRVSIAVAVEKGLPLEVNEWPAECAP